MKCECLLFIFLNEYEQDVCALQSNFNKLIILRIIYILLDVKLCYIISS